MFSCLTHTDMDECLIRPSVCPEKSECVNIAGDYDCECHAGYKYDPEARVCRGMTTSLCSTSAITILYTMFKDIRHGVSVCKFVRCNNSHCSVTSNLYIHVSESCIESLNRSLAKPPTNIDISQDLS